MENMVMVLEIKSDYLKVIDGNKKEYEYKDDMSAVINVLELEVGEVIERKELEQFLNKTI